MPDASLYPLSCPSCSAPLDYDGGSPTIRCPYCKTLIAVPDHLRAQGSAAEPRAIATIEEIRRLAHDGQLQEAIDRYREAYNVAASEAKLAVDALVGGQTVKLPPQILERSTMPPSHQVVQEIKALLQAGDKLAAIKRYREEYNVDLKDATDSIEMIAANLRGETVYQGDSSFHSYVPVIEDVPKKREGGAGGVRWSQILVPLAFVLLGGGFLLGIFLLPGGPFVPRLLAMNPSILIPSGQEDAMPEVVTIVRNISDEADVVSRLDPGGKPRWISQALDKSESSHALVYGNGMVFVASGANLVALDAADGKQAWQTQMTDKPDYGDSSMLVLGGRVIVQTLDKSLQAFDAQTGRPAWNRPIKSYARQLRAVGDQLMILDYTGDKNNFSLIFINPVDGKEQMVIDPVCTEADTGNNSSWLDTIKPEDGILYDAASASLYLIFGDNTGCVQHYAMPGGKMTWEIKQPKGFRNTPDGIYPQLIGGKLFFSHEHKLEAVDTAAVKMQTLLDDKSYNFLPLTISGERLIVRTVKAVGSKTFEVWGLDASSGQRKWQYSLGKGEPIDPPDEMSGLIDKDEFGWSWRVTPQGFVLIKFQAEPNQIVLETLNPQDGTSVGQKTISLSSVSGDFYSIPVPVGQQGSVFWWNIDTNMTAVDIEAGKVLYSWQ